MKQMINGVCCKTVGSEYNVYFDMALSMLEEIIANNKMGTRTVMIVPVGPTQQYPILAELVNRLNVSLKNVHFFNMDEYMFSPTEIIPHDNPLSFYTRMKNEFYDRVNEALVMPECQRHFPEPGKEAEYDRLIAELGGVSACYGGLGINGHVAFNEPESAMSADDFAALGTRVLPISNETKTINAYGYNRGDLRGMPEWCITVGMKQILSAKKIYIALNRPWQHGPLKHALLGEETAGLPASLLRRCPDLTYCGMDDVMKGIIC